MEKNFEEIDVLELVYLLLKKWYLIVVCLILATTTAFLVTKFYLKPVYKAESTLFLGKEPGQIALSITDIQLNNQLVVDYRQILKSRRVAKIINEKLGVDIKEFQSKVGVTTVKDSRIFSISYEDTDPELAANVVNELADVIQDLAAEIIEVKNVNIIDIAEIPDVPISPSTKKNVAVSAFLGLLLGAALIFLLEFIDHTFKKPEEVERHLGLNVIGTIPEFEGGKRGKKKAKDQKVLEQQYLKNLIAHNNPKAPATEAFRELRTNLYYTSVDKELKTLVVTSPTLGDGKTVTAVNLAVTLARLGKKVLIIDADMRKPKVHYYFGIKNKTGLTNILTEQNEDYKVKITQKDDIQNLYIITCGPVPPNPAEMLSSNKMKNLLDKLKDEYDLIIVDTPPVAQVTDAAIVAGITDGVLLVLASRQTRIEMAKRAKKLLNSVNANIIGTVLTKIENRRTGYYYYYKYE
ncbi:MAG TPA: polysaccharide biosynthesis tyrosine autokinase [Acetivibrio sp.]|nr:polysaccharide biosynthesis tyrosine autokinase [Acetivibrio sp.]